MYLAGSFLAFFILICDTEGSLQQLPADLYPFAKCNDGTQANYHVQNYHKQGKIVISLQGGGYCDSIDACAERCATTNLCTADKVPEMFDEFEAGEDPFKDYTQVRVHYCSSDTWSGTREASLDSGDLYFYGKHIFEAVIEDLALHFNLLESTNIVLTGGSAGAQGVAHRCDDFQEWVASQNPTIDVKCLLDSPEFYPPDVHTDDCANREPSYQNYLTEFWKRVEDKSCLQFANENNIENIGELCGVLANSLEFITTPLAMLTSHEDAVFTGAFGCQPFPNSPEHEEFRERWMAAHSELITFYMEEFPEMAWFAPNCKTHVIMNHPTMAVKMDLTGELVDVFTFVSRWLDGESELYANDDVTIENASCD